MRIEIQDLRKEYGATVAVRDLSFTVASPMMVGVIGRSGAGKSTLLRVINRLTPATYGQVLVDGVDALALRGRDMRAWQRDCAMIFQQFNLVPRLDVLTNVMLGRLNEMSALRSLFALFTEAQIQEALTHLERLGIAGQAMKRAESLSGGQQQRVAIARALMQRPRMMLADEPIASLDPMNAQQVMTALRTICDHDRTPILCNLHDLEAARGFCDRVIGLRAGELVFDGAPSELTPTAVREIYGADGAGPGGDVAPLVVAAAGPV